jgi:D-3-phosphoglycerate dehydrogenase / 2-oxoglutarate reductase
MKPLVLVAYHDYDDTSVEEDVLHVLDARVERVSDLLAPECAPLVREADALMVSTRPVSDAMLAALPRCQIISRVGTGVDSIDIDAATRRGIWVTNVPDYGVDEVSTHALALLLAWARRVPQLLASTRRGEWNYRVIEPIVRLNTQTLGVLGFGRIGRTLAAKARGVGLRVMVYDEFVPAHEIEREGVEPASFEDVLRRADYLSLHTPLTSGTRNLIDAAALELMKPTALLINTARGGLIDEDALLDALRAGRIGGVALDVLVTEPPPADHPLLHEPRAWITPHAAWFSEAASRDMRVRAAEEVVRVLRGERPRSRINELDGNAR